VTPRLAFAAMQSPSLGSPNGAGPAYELKFLIDAERAQQVEDWARRRLALDPHGDPALAGAYRTTSLYFDTPALDVYHRSPSYRRSKFRLRRYGDGTWIYLERKSKWGDRVRKRRTVVPDTEVLRLAGALGAVSWPGDWFHGLLLARDLRPAACLIYERTAYVGQGVCHGCVSRGQSAVATADTAVAHGGGLRLTLDRQARGILTEDWTLADCAGGLPLLTGQVILELKFHAALPSLFKELVQTMRLSPSAVSKYRLCRRAWGAVDA
jgi:VTC domain-containing protein